MREIVKDASGKTVGYKVQQGSQTIVQDASGSTLGRFDKNVNKTVDKSGKVRYSGDHTDTLFE
jgi:hypothetical protein